MTLEEEIMKLDLIASDAFEGGDADEFRKLASWLRELKAYREAEEEIDRKRKSGQWSEAVVFGMSRALLIMRRHIKEVNADE